MKRILLNDNWRVSSELSNTMMQLLSGASIADTEVTLPHDALLATGRSPEAVSGPGMACFNGGHAEYSRKLVVPESERDLVHTLYFDGVYMDATLTVNGVFVRRHLNGYTPFSARIDDYLRYDGPNDIRVSVRGRALPNARWYPGSGIYRDVHLEVGNRLHVATDGLRVMTLDCDGALGVISADAEIFNEDARAREGRVVAVVTDAEGTEVARRTAKFYVKAGDTVTVRQRIDIDCPRLWDAEHPNLYLCRCAVVEDGREIDSAETAFGIRTLKLDSRNGLRVNGKSVKLRGGCVHHDNGVIGAVTLPDAELRRVRLLKEGGYNAIRTSHNPPSPALLDACDQLGMYVMHEFTDVWTESKADYDYAVNFPMTWEQDVEDVTRRDRNHPCIVMWSIGNEIPETGNSVSAQWGRKLAEKFRALDPTRFITNGLNVMSSALPHMARMQEEMREQGVSGGLNDLMNDSKGMMKAVSASPITDELTEESCDMLDLVGYNYTEERYEREHEKYPYRVFFGSETFAANLDINWALVKKHPWVIGDFVWTAWDYIGEAGCGRIDGDNDGFFMGFYPWLLAMDGDFDLTGWRRPLSYWRETVWGLRPGKPYIAVHRLPNYGKPMYISAWNFTDAVASWTWPGYEGKTTRVEVYSDAAEAELFLNGQSLGRKPVGDDFKPFYCRWEVAYQPGALVCVAYNADGSEAGRSTLETAGEPKLAVTCDKKSLRAGSGDLAFIDIELRDAEGRLCAFSDRSAKIEICGPAELLGSGSANPKTEESYLDSEHLFFEGRMQAVLRAGKTAGETRVKVCVEGMESAEVTIACE